MSAKTCSQNLQNTELCRLIYIHFTCYSTHTKQGISNQKEYAVYINEFLNFLSFFIVTNFKLQYLNSRQKGLIRHVIKTPFKNQMHLTELQTSFESQILSHMQKFWRLINTTVYFQKSLQTWEIWGFPKGLLSSSMQHCLVW